MKLSNKILLGFFSFILIYMIAAFTEVRLKGDYNQMDGDSGTAESVDLPLVHHLILPDVQRMFQVRGSEQSRLETRSKSGNALAGLKYELHGDTLEIVNFEFSDGDHANTRIYLSKLRSLEVNGTSVFINDLQQDSLIIHQKGGLIRMQENNQLKTLVLESTSDADFEAAGFQLNNLTVQANRSNVRFYNIVNELNGGLQNNSRLFIRSANSIQFTKDESSHLDFN